jgi:hypothetical protein
VFYFAFTYFTENLAEFRLRLMTLIEVQTLPYADREDRLRFVQEELQLATRLPFDPSWLELRETILLEMEGKKGTFDLPTSCT